MKKLFLLLVTVFTAVAVSAQTEQNHTRTKTINSPEEKNPTTTTTIGKNTILTTTGQDNNGNTWILTQNVRKRLKNWNFVVIGKKGELLFSDSGKRGTFGKTADYQQGGWAYGSGNRVINTARNIYNYSRGYGVVNGSRITW